MSKKNITYCDFKDFSNSYNEYNEFLVFTVCIFGCILNCFNICVLTRKEMRCPTNYILTSLAITDILVMLEYMPFSYFHTKEPEKYVAFYFTYYFAVYMIFHAVFTQALHFTSCCLTIILALWRYVAVKFPENNNTWCSPNRTKWTIILTYILCPNICIPILLGLTVAQKTIFIDGNNKLSTERPQNISSTELCISVVEYDDSIKPISNWIYGIVVKLVPCILLTILSILLIHELFKAKSRRRKLLTPSTDEGNGMIRKKLNHRHLEKEKQADRTTKMLLAVLLLFLLVEFPQAILGMLNLDKTFENECYQPLGNLLDLIALLGGAINFFLYCIMSRKFRDIFKQIFFVNLFLSNPFTEWVALDKIPVKCLDTETSKLDHV